MSEFLSERALQRLRTPEMQQLLIETENARDEVDRGRKARIIGVPGTDPLIDEKLDVIKNAWKQIEIQLGLPDLPTKKLPSKLSVLFGRTDKANQEFRDQKFMIRLATKAVTSITGSRRCHSELAALELYGILPSLHAQSTVILMPRNRDHNRECRQRPVTDGEKYGNINNNYLFAHSGPALVSVAKLLGPAMATFETAKKFPHAELFTSILRDIEKLVLSIGRNMRTFPRDSGNHIFHIEQLKNVVHQFMDALSSARTGHIADNLSLRQKLEKCQRGMKARKDAFEVFERQQSLGMTQHSWTDVADDYDPTQLESGNFMPEEPRFQMSLKIPDLIKYLRDELGLKNLGDATKEPRSGGRPIERGGSAEVWQDILPKTSQMVALKLQISKEHPEWKLCSRILREARVWASTSHDNVIPLLGFWTNFRSDNPFPALVSPWCNDATLLDHVVKMAREICICNRLELIVQVARGLKHLHLNEREIVHGDLCANNVLMFEGRAVLTDFGNSRALTGPRGLTTDFHGNKRRLAPEFINISPQPTPTLTKASDIYSLGNLCIEVFTGKMPYPDLSDDYVQIEREDHGIHIPPRSTKIGDKHWAFLLKCFAFRPSDRPAVQKALAELEELHDEAVKAHSQFCVEKRSFT